MPTLLLIARQMPVAGSEQPQRTLAWSWPEPGLHAAGRDHHPAYARGRSRQQSLPQDSPLRRLSTWAMAGTLRRHCRLVSRDQPPGLSLAREPLLAACRSPCPPVHKQGCVSKLQGPRTQISWRPTSAAAQSYASSNDLAGWPEPACERSHLQGESDTGLPGRLLIVCLSLMAIEDRPAS